ncbi:MAG: hypothetical protein K6F69_07330, partial [Treponema sp.]|nr:hypothetical protein [Treponema sp.]
MASTLNIASILKHLTNKQKSGILPYREFCDYVYRYAQHHVNENPDLVAYMSSSPIQLQQELDELAEENQIFWITQSEEKKLIVVTSYYITSYEALYHDMETNPAIPFPVITDLPKKVPKEIVTKVNAPDFVAEYLEKTLPSEEVLFAIELPRNIAPILLPSTVSLVKLLDAALAKIQRLLLKEESHDYFLKKLKIANQGKELSISNFFDKFVQNPKDAINALRNNGDTFYFWSQLCYFIKQDYEKVKDYTLEDISILQAVYIAEYASSYYKNKTQKDSQRETAFKMLDASLQKPPYYFTYTEISKLLDPKGVPLLGQYSEQELNDYLHDITSSSDEKSLPRVLVFRTDGDQRFFIMKDKVIPLIVRLCSDARVTVRDTITNEWFNCLKQFGSLPEMKNQFDFEKRLEQEVDVSSPVLFALLNAPFLPSIHYEMIENQEPSSEMVNLFINGKLIPYSEILMMSRQEVLADAKIMLPFWYSIPVVSWFMSLLFRPAKKKTQKKTSAQKIKEKENKNANIAREAQEEAQEASHDQKSSPKISRARELRASAQYAETQLVPASSTLERELVSYIHEWNQIIDKTASDNLVEDVNSLIRDYLRKVLRNKLSFKCRTCWYKLCFCILSRS